MVCGLSMQGAAAATPLTASTQRALEAPPPLYGFQCIHQQPASSPPPSPPLPQQHLKYSGFSSSWLMYFLMSFISSSASNTSLRVLVMRGGDGRGVRRPGFGVGRGGLLSAARVSRGWDAAAGAGGWRSCANHDDAVCAQGTATARSGSSGSSTRALPTKSSSAAHERHRRPRAVAYLLCCGIGGYSWPAAMCWRSSGPWTARCCRAPPERTPFGRASCYCWWWLIWTVRRGCGVECIVFGEIRL